MICLSETYIFDIENDVKACLDDKIKFISDLVKVAECVWSREGGGKPGRVV